MRKATATLAIITSLTGAAPALSQPSSWDMLNDIRVSEIERDGAWHAVKKYPDGLREVAPEFRISGYVVPIQVQPYITQFLLVEDPTGCPFCGTSGYGVVLEVHLKKPLPDSPEFSTVQLRGHLDLIVDPETYQAVMLRDAVVLSVGAPPEPALPDPVYEAN